MQQQKVEGDLSALGFWSNSKNSMIPNPPKKSLKEPIFFLRGHQIASHNLATCRSLTATCMNNSFIEGSLTT
jgi:hypothetical protein